VSPSAGVVLEPYSFSTKVSVVVTLPTKYDSAIDSPMFGTSRATFCTPYASGVFKLLRAFGIGKPDNVRSIRLLQNAILKEKRATFIPTTPSMITMSTIGWVERKGRCGLTVEGDKWLEEIDAR
jgi:hypothetical protein